MRLDAALRQVEKCGSIFLCRESEWKMEEVGKGDGDGDGARTHAER